MKKISISILSMLVLLLFSGSVFAQKMSWTTSSKAAKELAQKGSDHMLNVEFAEGYDKLSQALELDPDFTVALVLMANLTTGDLRKSYSERAKKSAGEKTEGEKLFASLVDEEGTQESRREIWLKLHQMFPDDAMLGDRYVQTRATPEERLIEAQEYIKKFPKQPAMYNAIAYYYLGDKKDNGMALKNFEKYISLYPNGSNPYDSMGEYYLTTGDKENAKKYYKLALQKYPFSNSSLNALQKMADEEKMKESTED